MKPANNDSFEYFSAVGFYGIISGSLISSHLAAKSMNT